MTVSAHRARLTLAVAAVAAVAALIGLLAPRAEAVAYDPGTCTAGISYDPSIPTPESVVGTPLAPNTGGDNASNNAAKKNTAILYPYLKAIAQAAPGMVIHRSAGTSALGRDIPYVIVSSPGNIADLEDDAAFWRGVRAGEIAPATAERAVASRPAFAWIVSNVHGDEPSSAEATIRLIYELAARRDCANYQRLEKLTSFLMPVQNPDGRDEYQRTNAWTFDLNRDWHTQEQAENYLKMGSALEYPSVVYVDAHQQGGSSFFFPPNEDPVHHEISNTSVNHINFVYGPALQKRFNDQNISYNNYNSYDLFTPEYGDTAPSLLLGAAGMTFEKGRGGSYAKQVYDHYLSLDETLNVTARQKREILDSWVDQWYEAIAQGAAGELQPNRIVSPDHTISWEVPDQNVFGYYFLPNNHDGDVAKMISVLQRAGVNVYQLTEDTPVSGLHVFGDMQVNDPNALGPERQTPATQDTTLPAGTLWIPMAQSMKHWIQALLGEDPFVPYAYFYDVAGWSFSQLKGMSGNGYLMESMPAGARMAPIAAPDFGTSPARSEYYAFSTDSSRGLIMAYQIAKEGAGVYRTDAGFSAGGRSFPTGTAIVDGETASAQGIDVAAMSDTYQTPVTGLSSPPDVDTYALETPKIAIYGQFQPSGSPAPPAVDPTVPPAGRCNGGTTYCQAYFTLTDKMGLEVTNLTAAEIAGGALDGEGYTALVNPNSNITGDAATAIQAFVNDGGNYFGFGSNALTTARNAGLTLANSTANNANGPTGGVPVTAEFDTDSPLAWGFDNGGFLYRVSGSFTVNPSTMAGNDTIPDATAPVAYPNPTLRFAYSDPESGGAANQVSRLNGTPAFVEVSFGSGTASVLTVDPTFRAWIEGEERLILNGALYPNGAPVELDDDPDAPAPRVADPPIPAAQLPVVKSRPVTPYHDPEVDVVITVAKKHGKVLRKAFKASRAPKKIRKKARFKRDKRTVTLIVRGARTGDTHGNAWAVRVAKKLERKGIEPKKLQL